MVPQPYLERNLGRADLPGMRDRNAECKSLLFPSFVTSHPAEQGLFYAMQICGPCLFNWCRGIRLLVSPHPEPVIGESVADFKVLHGPAWPLQQRSPEMRLSEGAMG